MNTRETMNLTKVKSFMDAPATLQGYSAFSQEQNTLAVHPFPHALTPHFHFLTVMTEN